MKNLKTALLSLAFLLVITSLFSCIISNAKPEDCVAKEITVTEITEGSSFDIKLYDGKTDYYYINRGLETGGTMEGFTEAILNKKVTLHLYKFIFGVESEHVSQLAIEDTIIFTEFN